MLKHPEPNNNLAVLLASIVQFSNDAIISKDLEGIIKSWNKSAEKLYGYTAEEVIGQHVNLIVPKEESDELIDILERLKRGQAIEHFKATRVRKDGQRIVVDLTISPIKDSSGRVIGASTIARDITASEQAEVKFRGLLESAPDAMIIVDRNGNINLVNSQVKKIFGYDQEELLGKPVEILIPQRFNHHAVYREQYFKESRARPMGAGLALYARRKDGTEFPVEISLSPMHTREGIIVTAAVRDVTDRKKGEELLRISLQEKEVLLKEIHHRVKNNLQIISSLINLQMNSVSDDSTRLILRESQSRVKSIALAHEKLYQSSSLEKINFKEYLSSLLRYLFQTYSPSQDIRYYLDIDKLQLDLDSAVHCGLIVNELSTNALKHAFPKRDSGNIWISVSLDRDITLKIKDDGIGIPKEFDFKSNKTLGLQLVNTLVAQMDGSLSLIQDCGTEFIITLKIGGQEKWR